MVDLHGNRRIIECLSTILEKSEIEGIIIGGDVTNFGTIYEAIEILKNIKEAFGKRIYFVPGNCDDRKLLDWSGENGIENIHLKAVKIGEANVLGLGGSLTTPFYTNIEFSNEEIKNMLENFLNEKINIFVTHSPPYGTKLDIVYGGRHVGSQAIKSFIEKTNPEIVLTGHIHESAGMDKIGETVAVNPGPASRGNYAIITFSDNKAEVNVSKV